MHLSRKAFAPSAIVLCCACAPGASEHPRELEMTTWSIASIDPETGDVGVAVSSCVESFGDAVVALVPRRGAIDGGQTVAVRLGQHTIAMITTRMITAPITLLFVNPMSALTVGDHVHQLRLERRYVRATHTRVGQIYGVVHSELWVVEKRLDVGEIGIAA